MNYVRVIGGEVFSLGKGTAVTSLGRLCTARGYRVAVQTLPATARKSAKKRKQAVLRYSLLFSLDGHISRGFDQLLSFFR